MAALTPLLHQVRRLAEDASLRPLTDRQLLEAFLCRNDPSAFEALVRRHGPLVLSACRRVLRDPADVEDAFQATFLTLLRKAGAVRWRESVAGWLFGAAHRIAVQARANARRRHQRESAAGLLAPHDEPPPDLSWREAVGVLHEELDGLPDRFRRPLLLCYLEGKTREEAAAALGWSAGAVKGRLERGRALLRRRLGRRGICLCAGLLAALASPPARALPARLLRATVHAATAGPSAAVAALAGGAPVLLGGKLKLAAGFLLCLGLIAAVASYGLPAQRGASPPAGKSSPAEHSSRPRPPRAATAPRAGGTKADTTTVTGVVLRPDGKPLAGADVFFWPRDAARPVKKPRATAGRDGHFSFELTAAEAHGGGTIVARADGFRADWADLKTTATGKGLTLRPGKDDLAVTGRVLDLEGRPVAGVTVRVSQVGKYAEGPDLRPWVDKVMALQKRGGYHNGTWLTPAPPEALGVPLTATTDKDGRFRLSGFGRERALALEFRGPATEYVFAWAMTRPRPKKPLIPGRWGALHGSSLELTLAPTKPITGTVRDRKTGKPVAGVRVSAMAGVSTTTDSKGQYRLVGLPKRKEYTVFAWGRKGVPYWGQSKEVADTPGLTPLTVDFALVRGVEITGRLTDSAGKPVRGTVDYYYFPANHHLKTYPIHGRGSEQYFGCRTAPDGSFTVVGVPGPGALLAYAESGAYRVVDVIPELHGDWVVNGVPGYQIHAIKRIDPDPEDPKTLRHDLVLGPGRTLAGSITDPGGKPLAGARAAGLWSGSIMDSFGDRPAKPLPGAEFTAAGLDPRRPRSLLFVHPEKNLGKLATVRGDEPAPFTVRLEPLGALCGQVRSGGRPLAGAAVTLDAEVNVDYARKRKDLPWSELYIGSIRTTLRRTVTTDSEGKFRVDGLLPGIPYELRVTDKDRAVRHEQSGLGFESGKVKDLGVIRVKDRRDGG
jgi:RNA polymerase sigma factor (sigma-70 family)